jgi:DNA-binding response OmpR family regulator
MKARRSRIGLMRETAEGLYRLRNDAKLPPGIRLLLVEDEPLIAIDTQDILRAFGVHEVVWARNMTEAEAAIEADAFHVALLDLRLGSNSGVPIAQRLAADNIPFGFLTGFHDSSVPPELKDRPILTKPFAHEELHALLLLLVTPSKP